MLLSKAIEGYFYDKQATYSPDTLEGYKFVFQHLIEFVGDKEAGEVTAKELHDFIIWLQKDYVPSRWNKDTSPLSGSGVELHWKGVRSLFKWLNDTLDLPRPDMKMPRPEYMRPHVTAFTEEEIRKLIKFCDYADVERDGKKHKQRLPEAHRDKAIVLTLLDTGMRVGELLRVKMEDVNMEQGEILVTPFRTGKKSRPRLVVLGHTARRAIWLYTSKIKALYPSSVLFPMTDDAVRHMLKRLEERSGVTDVHPHRFRHSMAIWFLRNGGDIFTLQRLLGHSTLDMVNTYLDIAQTDIALAHRRASALDRWNSEKPL
jgi:integrase/recombinase XerD